MRSLVTAPASRHVGLTTVTTGLVHALDRRGVRVGFCKPIAQPLDGGEDRSNAFVRAVSMIRPPEPISLAEVEALLRADRDQDLMELVAARCLQAGQDCDVLVVEGLAPTEAAVYATRVNNLMAKALDADLVLVTTPHGLEASRVADAAAIAAHAFRLDRPAAVIVNRANLVRPARVVGEHAQVSDLAPVSKALTTAFADARMPLAGLIPYDAGLAVPRFGDVATAIGAHPVLAGDTSRRVHSLALAGQPCEKALVDMRPGTLLVAPVERADLILAASASAANGLNLAGLILVGDVQADARILSLCRGIAGALPVWTVAGKALDAVTAIQRMNLEIPVDDRERIQDAATGVAEHLERGWLDSLTANARETRLSPPAFRHRLIQEAQKANKRIVLPEGTEPRTLKAVQICHERKIARCVLLGNPQEIRDAALKAGVTLPEDVEIIDHLAEMPRLAPILMELRKAKGMTRDQAEQELSDTIMPGTLLLKLGEVDGLVSGAVHTTAHTIRPALQLIKTAPGCSLVSSIFFICLPEQVVVFGDCAVNPNPTSEQLADIAIQSAESAIAFGIPARVAMLSYSTGESGTGADVELVKQASAMAKAKRPDLAIDGPLQYDAATQMDVARSKAPKSAVAGKATVLIFPDLNTGNVTYKAVQRSANVVSIGPMLQGMAKPVNDLSRGALVDDIVFTIALTAIQAAAVKPAARAAT